MRVLAAKPAGGHGAAGLLGGLLGQQDPGAGGERRQRPIPDPAGAIPDPAVPDPRPWPSYHTQLAGAPALMGGAHKSSGMMQAEPAPDHKSTGMLHCIIPLHYGMSEQRDDAALPEG